MDMLTAGQTMPILVMAVAITLAAGFVKGAVGFAMPMIMISGLGSILPPELALAALIVPTVLTNLWQALRGGVVATFAATRHHWLFLCIVVVFIAGSAQLVRVLSAETMFLILGLPIVIFALTQLLGWRLRFKAQHRRKAEVLTASFAGFVGGLSGVWGPPTVAYLTALDTPKDEQMRIQGVIYGVGAVVLMAAHIRSGVFSAGTAPFSVFLTVPALIGTAIGFRLGDRLDQHRFRKATLAVLAVAGLNLVRRGLGL